MNRDNAWMALKWVLTLILGGGVLWSVHVLADVAAGWLLVLVSLAVTVRPWGWIRVILPLVLVVLALLLLPGLTAGFVIVLNILLLAVDAVLRKRDWSGFANVGITLVTLALLLLVIEIAAPGVTESIAEAQRQSAIEQAREEAAPPLAAEAVTGETVQPVSASPPQAEFIERGPGPAWGELTGWGTNTDTVMRYWMDGVYDVELTYNSLGFRGPEIAYEKPDDVYRIMLVGDSFIEAREVAYADTVYAQLGDLLAETADGKRIEVFGVGAVGWGTLQAYLYYHHEGYRFDPDLVVHFFVINDVADNYPAQFYPDREIDFVVDESSVQVVRESTAVVVETERSDWGRWLDALPQTNTTALLRQVFDPPRERVTLSGNLANLHPQGYIFVREPSIDGYPEAWRRTARAYEIWTEEVRASGSELMVVAVDISVERITEISTYYFEEQDGWVWDVDLPYTRLSEILDPLSVELVNTRAHYAAYAASVELRPYDALFYVEDGHWNPNGHRVTAELLADELRRMGIVAD